jgi:hypothetical protein
MDQLHRRLTVEQVKVLLHSYCQGTLSRADAQEVLGIGKIRFFALVQEYRSKPTAFSITYERETHARISAKVERAIELELQREQKLVDDPRFAHFRLQLLRYSGSIGEERDQGFGNDDHRACQTTGLLQTAAKTKGARPRSDYQRHW